MSTILNADERLQKLSSSHFSLLLPIKDADKRAFYENASMQSNWSVYLSANTWWNYQVKSNWRNLFKVN